VGVAGNRAASDARSPILGWCENASSQSSGESAHHSSRAAVSSASRLPKGRRASIRAVQRDDPQHARFKGEPSSVEIGHHNVFREHVTVHRAATPGGVTRSGNHNYLMASSHVPPDTMTDGIRVASGPVISSHSNARAIGDVPRNVPDAILRQLPKNGGVVMVTFVPGFTSPDVIAQPLLIVGV